mmetsp:Transcript_125515/g.349392  ORF Transcript_125515/g.349392 Transcript_125515/m.349392 type:complete len:219 (+) Transcript_125515:422-1078(+)
MRVDEPHDVCNAVEEHPPVFLETRTSSLGGGHAGVAEKEGQHREVVGQVRETKGVPLGLGPTRSDCPVPSAVLGHVVHRGQGHWLDLRRPHREEEALDAHVPILCDPLSVPATDVPRELQGERVRGVRKPDGVGVREHRDLRHGGEHRPNDQQHGLPVVVFDVKDGRLPERQATARRFHLDELSREAFEVSAVEIGVCVSDGEQHAEGILPGIPDSLV